MATVDYTKNIVQQPPHAFTFIVKRRISFAALAASSADVIQCVSVPAQTFVHQVMVQVVTAEGATCTAKVGDGVDDDGFDASTNLNATAGTVTNGVPGTDAYLTAGGRPYTSADTIDLTLGNNAATAVVDIFVVMSFMAPAA